MRTRRDPKKKRPEQAVRFLVCDGSGRSDLKSDSEEWVRSPIQCLDRAVDGDPDIIVVRFGPMPIRERETLVELCASLKRNSRTRKKTVLALLHGRHRGILEALARAGVDFVQNIAETPLNSALVMEIIHALGADHRVEPNLANLCPHLHYDSVDAEVEITLCGAYLDRMVLGGKWLHEMCETESHFKCEYFLKPRFKP